MQRHVRESDLSDKICGPSACKKYWGRSRELSGLITIILPRAAVFSPVSRILFTKQRTRRETRKKGIFVEHELDISGEAGHSAHFIPSNGRQRSRGQSYFSKGLRDISVVRNFNAYIFRR
jgi:hypothetical protein